MGDGGLGLGMGIGIRAALGRWAASMLHARRGVVDSGACPPLGTGRQQQQQASKQQASPGEGHSRRRVQNSPLCRDRTEAAAAAAHDNPRQGEEAGRQTGPDRHHVGR